MTSNLDLFGNPVDDPPTVAAPAAVPVNDMDRAESVLADVLNAKTLPLHRDDDGTVRRCAGSGTTPAAPEVAATVTQLIATRYLTTATRRQFCTEAAHGPTVVATPFGRNAAHRWNAYARPTSWSTPSDHASSRRGDGLASPGRGDGR